MLNLFYHQLLDSYIIRYVIGDLKLLIKLANLVHRSL